ncbi:hypothetical protein D3C83_29740 [compost metagenome]
MMSFQFGSSPWMLLVNTSRFSPCSRLRMISEKPKVPIAMVPMPMPSISSGRPKL